MNGMSCPGTLDTGANMTAVPGRFIAPMQFTGKNIRVVFANMDTTSLGRLFCQLRLTAKLNPYGYCFKG